MDIIDEIDLQTGDLVLFTGNTMISRIIQYFQHNKFSHVGIIIKNPKFLDPSLEDGLYLLESGFEPIGNRTYGVQLHLLEDILKLCSKGTVYTRKVVCERNTDFYEKFSTIYQQIKDIPYDINIFDWIAATFKLDYNLSDNANYFKIFNIRIPIPFRKTNHFWCSSMTAYVFCKLGLIDENINWTLISPSEFDNSSIQFLCQINPKKILF